MSWFAHLMYRALLWKEKQRAGRAPANPLPKGVKSEAAHLDTGRRGETLAYWYLRQAGYRVVARNRRLGSHAGELDLVAWDGPILAFVEVKARTSDAAGPPEAALRREQQRRIARGAREYMRRLRVARPSYRFDVVSVFWTRAEGFQVRLIKDAFKDPA
jgi:putative endonuclease